MRRAVKVDGPGTLDVLSGYEAEGWEVVAAKWRERECGVVALRRAGAWALGRWQAGRRLPAIALPENQVRALFDSAPPVDHEPRMMRVGEGSR